MQQFFLAVFVCLAFLILGFVVGVFAQTRRVEQQVRDLLAIYRARVEGKGVTGLAYRPLLDEGAVMGLEALVKSL